MRVSNFVVVVVVVVFVIAAVGVASATECNEPPSRWCRDDETARRCGVLEMCRESREFARQNGFFPSAAKKPVNVTLAFESYCPGCRYFIKTQLWPTYQLLKDYMTVKLLPYGNAKEVKNNKTGQWDFYCQHGPQECHGNVIESCAIFLNNRQEEYYFPFIHCMEKNDPINDYKKCATEHGQDLSQLEACITGSEGKRYQHIIATETPKHEYVPWIIFNGDDSLALQTKARDHLKLLVCETIPDPKPSVCTQEPEKLICWK